MVTPIAQPKLPADVTRFLASHNALNKFLRNITLSGYDDYFERAIDAFSWNDSLEGFDYWDNLDDLWTYNA